MPNSLSPHAILLFQDRTVVYANLRAVQLSGREMDDLVGMDLQQVLFSYFSIYSEKIERLFRWAEKGEHADPQSGVELTDLEGNTVWIDLLLSPTFFHGAPAVQMVWIDNTARLQAEARLSENIWRLQILQDINNTMLSAQDDNETANAALRHISFLATDYHSSMVHLLDTPQNTAHLVASDSPFSDLREPIQWELLVEFPENLTQGLPQVVSDLDEIEPRNPLLERLYRLGVRSTLVVPMCWDGVLQGLLSVYSSTAGEFNLERIQTAQEIANLLAIAFKHNQLNQLEVDRRLVAEAVLGVFSASLQGKGSDQTILAIVNGAQRLLRCEWVWFFQQQGNDRYGMPGLQVNESGQPVITVRRDDPLIRELEQSRAPLIISDLQSEPFYQSWLELEPIRSWMAVPFLHAEQLSGFLVAGSIQPGAFTFADADRLRDFVEQITPAMRRFLAIDFH